MKEDTKKHLKLAAIFAPIITIFIAIVAGILVMAPRTCGNEDHITVPKPVMYIKVDDEDMHKLAAMIKTILS